METNIQIKMGDIKVIEKLKEIFTPKEGEYQVDAMELVQRLADESESNIPDLHDRLKDKADSREKILDYIAYCLSSEKFPTPVLNIVKDIVP